MHGWLPVTVQIIAAVALIAAVSRRSGRWQVRWLPWALIVGAALAASAYWYVASQGSLITPRPCAVDLVGLTGFAAAELMSASTSSSAFSVHRRGQLQNLVALDVGDHELAGGRPDAALVRER